MKKSTILFVALIYIVSFLIVGFFGIRGRAYFENIYVDHITLTIATGQSITIKEQTDHEEFDDKGYVRLYRFATRFEKTEEDGMKVLFKADVYPENATYKEVKPVYDSEQSVYSVSVNNLNYITLTFLEKGTANFKIESTDGAKYSIQAIVAAL